MPVLTLDFDNLTFLTDMAFWCPGLDAPDILAVDCCMGIEEIGRDVTGIACGKFQYRDNPDPRTDAGH